MIRFAWATLCRLILIAAVGVFGVCFVAICMRYPWIAVVLGLGAAWRSSRCWRGSSSHGTARFVTTKELEQSGMLSGDTGFLAGRLGWAERPGRIASVVGLLSPRVRSHMACAIFLAAFWRSRCLSNRLIRIKDVVHAATFSRTGGGKGVSVVIPTLLSDRRSMVIIDPKCENFFKTNACRKRMGHLVVRLDPMLLGGPGAASFNPLAFIDAKAPDFLDQCRDLANMLVVRQGTEQEPFWNDAAEMLICSVIAFVCACEPNPSERNLQTVRRIISDDAKYTRAIEVMRQVDNPVVQRLGGQLTFLVDRERGGVLTNVQRHTNWMDSATVAACLTRNTFDPRDLRRKKVSVYLVVPPNRLVTWAPLIRVWIGSFLQLLIREGADKKHQVIFMLDEIGQLGRLQVLEDAVNIVRGYGIRLHFIFQSLSQVKKCYGEHADVILDNIGTMQFFALGNALGTAEMISRRIGDETIRIHTPTTGENDGTGTTSNAGGTSRNRSTSRGMNTAELARKVLLPDEILRLPDDVSLVFHNNMPVIPTRLVRYYDAPEFKWNRMGRHRGLGLAAGFLAMLTLAASVSFAVFLHHLPLPRMAWQPGMSDGYFNGSWQNAVSRQWQAGLPSPSIFPELEPLRFRQPGESIFPELEPVPYRKPSRRRPTSFRDLIRID